MNHVIDKLSGIEHDATAIMDAANARKKEISQEIADKTASFDTQLEADTTSKINDLKANMEEEMQAKLSKLKSDAQEVLAQMQESYHANHETYAKELFKAMIAR